MKQPRSKSETAEQLDDTDASVDYQNFENENLPGEEREREEDLEFVNPLFKQKPRLFNSTIDKIDDEDYSKLAFQNSATNTPKDSPIQTVKKKPEQIEMGVKNYGYMNENSSRPASWDSTLSAFNPYAIDTPIGEPVNARHPSVGMEMSESPPTHRQNSITKKSDYSSISDVNPYMTPTEKSPQYEDLAGIRNNHTNNKQIIPSSNKKMNMIYEPAVISRHSETYRKKTSVSEEGSYSDNSSYCHLMFTILIGILAIVALLIAFLVVFGVVSAKKCKECDVTTVSTGAATGGIDQKELDLQLAYIKGNLTLLQNVLHANSSVTIATLQRDLDAQKSLVASLTTQLNKQKQLTASLNQHTRSLQFKVKKLNETVNLKTHELQVKLQKTEKNVSTFKNSLHKTKSQAMEAIKNQTSYFTNIMKEKVSLSNYSTFKEATLKSLQNITLKVTVNMMNYHMISSNIKTLDASLNDTNNEVAALTNYTDRLHDNLTAVVNKVSAGGGKGSCTRKSGKSHSSNAVSSTVANAYTPLNFDWNTITSASCSGNAVSAILMKDDVNKRFYCQCIGVYKDNSSQDCIIDYWVCPK